MSKLVIEIEFDEVDEKLSDNDKWEISGHLSGLLTEEFSCYPEEYPPAEVNAHFIDENG